jgi:hypothetical protein
MADAAPGRDILAGRDPELANGARRAGQRVLWGRAVEERGAPPLWPWRRILAAVGGASEPDMLAGEPERRRGR